MAFFERPGADRTSLIQKTHCHSFHSIGEANFFSADVFDELETSKTKRAWNNPKATHA